MFPTPLKCSFTRPGDKWAADEAKANNPKSKNDSKGVSQSQRVNNRAGEELLEQQAKTPVTPPKCLTRTFSDAAKLKEFLITYEMTIEKCLKSLAMDPACQKACSEKPIHEFGQQG